MANQLRLVEVRRNVLKHNDVVAHALRDRFRQAGVTVVSLVSSPGSGKTFFLEKTLTLLQQVSDHLQQRGRRGAHQNRPGGSRRIRLARG